MWENAFTDKKFCTIKEVANTAEKFGRKISQEYIRQKCTSGDIPAIKPGRDWLIPGPEACIFLIRWLQNKETKENV